MKNRKLILLLFSSLSVLGLLLWLSGGFSPKISTGNSKHENRDIKGQIVPVRLVKMPLSESAVGTVQAVHETSIASKILARVTELNFKAGQPVKKADVLLRLDDTDLRAKLQQTKSSVSIAEAARSQAENDEKRLGILIKSNAVSKQEYEKTVTKLKSSEAELRRTQESVNEVQSILDYATILSPMDGIVIDKKVDVGDTVIPGQVLVKLYDPSRMQLVANVRESLVHRLSIGQDIGVKIDSLDKVCRGTVSEIVPESSSTSRTFLLKVTGPCPSNIYTGMFGRVMIPIDDEQILLIPTQAVKKAGQIEMVELAENGEAVLRAIRTGRKFGDDLEVLSGLREGEKVIVPGMEGTDNAR